MLAPLRFEPRAVFRKTRRSAPASSGLEVWLIENGIGRIIEGVMDGDDPAGGRAIARTRARLSLEAGACPSSRVSRGYISNPCAECALRLCSVATFCCANGEGTLLPLEQGDGPDVRGAPGGVDGECA